jgi:hypothetical protein
MGYPSGFPQGWGCLSKLASIAGEGGVPQENVVIRATTAILPVMSILTVHAEEPRHFKLLDIFASLRFAHPDFLGER